MELHLKKGFVNDIIFQENDIRLTLCDFSILLKDERTIIGELFLNDINLLNLYFSNDEIVDMILLGNIEEMMIKKSIPILKKKDCYIELSKISNGYKKMKDIGKLDLISIVCDKDSLLDALNFSQKIDIPVDIYGDSISMYDYEKILSCYDLSSSNNKDVSIRYQRQSNSTDINMLYKTACEVNNISKEIESGKFTPIESVMYLYDLLKEKKYVETEDAYESRDLHRILFNDKIVCVGYSNIMSAVLKNLNINMVPLIIPANDSMKRNGHQRGLVYVRDDVYGIDGVYVFDPTFDRKRENNPDGSYKYFGMSITSSEEKMHSDMYSYLCMDFEDIVDVIKNNGNGVENISNIMNLINPSFYSKFRRLCRNVLRNENELYEMYSSIWEQYEKDDLDRDTIYKIRENVNRKKVNINKK